MVEWSPRWHRGAPKALSQAGDLCHRAPNRKLTGWVCLHRGFRFVFAVAMQNRFYQEFDREAYNEVRQADYRTAFQVDRDRIIHAHAFRKLQSKTQVFLSGEYDFYRTRLTHSMEVAQIGRSICHFLRTERGPMKADFFIDDDLVEAVCLAHDLGHPPVGPSGEATLPGV